MRSCAARCSVPGMYHTVFTRVAQNCKAWALSFASFAWTQVDRGLIHPKIIMRIHWHPKSPIQAALCGIALSTFVEQSMLQNAGKPCTLPYIGAHDFDAIPSFRNWEALARYLHAALDCSAALC
mmetsp:Transcript_62642/g.117177  ORF Transcript_62642/g.117177 Transcript_62642/m.117177 type:complete len:124 (+) Transcript_62642:48-419(+)